VTGEGVAFTDMCLVVDVADYTTYICRRPSGLHHRCAVACLATWGLPALTVVPLPLSPTTSLCLYASCRVLQQLLLV
jgi:hypothetical protein